MILYPQLPHPAAEQLAQERRLLSVADVAGLAAVEHAEAIFTPTGGARAERRDLERLRTQLVEIAEGLGYPGEATESARLRFDMAIAESLFKVMQMAPSEASKPGIWEFLACVLLCDLVKWRFPGGTEGVPLERYFAGRRNTFQRLWWRAFILSEEETAAPYQLLKLLGEDELVQIMERPYLAGSRSLSRTVARELLIASERHPRVARRILIREAQKRLRRLAAFTSLEVLEEAVLGRFVKNVFDEVAMAVPPGT
jgi:hypothetical protein